MIQVCGAETTTIVEKSATATDFRNAESGNLLLRIAPQLDEMDDDARRRHNNIIRGQDGRLKMVRLNCKSSEVGSRKSCNFRQWK
eukprot:2976180-Pleurochrysis_carterae.AAC.1